MELTCDGAVRGSMMGRGSAGGRSIRKRTVGKWPRIALPQSLATAPG